METHPDWPPQDAVLAVHERFVREIVEGMSFCPFARKSREMGRVHRPVFRLAGGDPTPESVAEALGALVGEKPDTEIVLLTFPAPRGHAWLDSAVFEKFVTAVREAYIALADRLGSGSVFYMVGFHPSYTVDESKLTAESLVPLLRRTPDPVIQCVNAETLDEVRRQAQITARERMRKELLEMDPGLAEMFDRTVSPDPQLSADIARQNFEGVSKPNERARLEALIADIHRQRERSYYPGEHE